MPLSIAERKHQMPYGAQKVVAKEQGVTEPYVSDVMSGSIAPKTKEGRQKLRRVQVAIARKIGKPVDEVFPQENQEPALAQAS